MRQSCHWATNHSLMQEYHDTEWGVPLHDDRKLFEFLVLEGFQAGLSWLIVLKKREAFREAFDDFDPAIVACYDAEKINSLLQNPEIIRNRQKIEACVNNARCFLKIQQEFGSFDRYIWGFVDYQPVVNHFTDLSQLPARTPLSDQISADLKKRGFKFVGSTVVYAHLQATGMVNDHLVHCWRHSEVAKPAGQ
ncbi:MAG TPA: DNA-3-methyladenine glycosylase I [Prolixibacteraceae bacterium]|nr:DNA-3-methyladenine glycosylase I [Prolixibacteraceae bacterium]